ncbi:MAG TPA: GTPase Era [Spirochaetia bacterium]|nr:GTPase Era [Spirochaetia bacterium]
MDGKEREFKSGFVAVVGRPNVGKSTLLNTLVGRKVAIVSDKPQTTRITISAVLTMDRAQAVFLDTPGVHRPRHRLSDRMVKSALASLREVDLILFLVEAGPPGAGDRFVLERLKPLTTPVFLVINKVDLLKKTALLADIDVWRQEGEFAEIVPVSAKTGENTDRLVDLVVQYLPPGPAYYPADMVSDRPEQFLMGELVREKVLLLTGQEVPHSVAVVIEENTARPDGTLYVRAIIYTEKDSQKAILVGHGGTMLKKVGTLAREEMEKIFGTKVYLDLWVKVKEDWRNREDYLRIFGYE